MIFKSIFIRWSGFCSNLKWDLPVNGFFTSSLVCLHQIEFLMWSVEKPLIRLNLNTIKRDNWGFLVAMAPEKLRRWVRFVLKLILFFRLVGDKTTLKAFFKCHGENKSKLHLRHSSHESHVEKDCKQWYQLRLKASWGIVCEHNIP